MKANESWVHSMGVLLTIMKDFTVVFVVFLQMRGLEKKKSTKSVKLSKKVL